MRIATFNILHGRSPVDDSVELTRFADAVRALDADIIALQEVDRDQPRSHLADLTAVAAEAAGAREHRFLAAISGTPGATWMAATGTEQPGAASYGIALLSRYPVRSWQSLRLPRIPFRFPMWLPGPRRVIVVDEEPRAVLVAVIDSPAGPMCVVNTHLSYVPGWNGLQLRRLCRDLAAFPDPLLLLGDLNLDAPRPQRITGYRPLAAAATFPRDAPERQLDHILLRGAFSRPCTGDGGRAVRLPVSDHRALVVDLERDTQAETGTTTGTTTAARTAPVPARSIRTSRTAGLADPIGSVETRRSPRTGRSEQ